MTAKIPDFSEGLADGQGKATRNWYNYWKDLGTGIQSGSFTFTGVTTTTITLSPPMPTAQYNVFFDAPIGTATWATNKGTTSFIANTSTASSLTWGWSAIRR